MKLRKASVQADAPPDLRNFLERKSRLMGKRRPEFFRKAHVTSPFGVLQLYPQRSRITIWKIPRYLGEVPAIAWRTGRTCRGHAPFLRPASQPLGRGEGHASGAWGGGVGDAGLKVRYRLGHLGVAGILDLLALELSDAYAGCARPDQGVAQGFQFGGVCCRVSYSLRYPPGYQPFRYTLR